MCISGVTIKLSQLVLACIPKTARHESTMKPLWQAIAASFKKLAKEGKGILFVLAGDLEYFSSEFGWPTAMSNYPCPYCSCDNLFDMEKSKHPFTDFRKNATWKKKLRGVAAPPPVDHPLWQVPGVNFWTMKLDLLHLVDLGVACHIYGNLLAALIQKSPLNKKQTLVEVNKLVAKNYQELGIEAGKRLPRLNASDVFADDFPVLRHVKGRRVRRFAPVATKLAATLATDEKGKHILALCKAMEEAYNLCDKKEFVWEMEDRQKFESTCGALLAHYGWLAKDSMKRGEHMWSIVQKHHLLAHFPSQCQYLAPRGCWAYGGESFMSLMVTLASGSVKSTPAWMLPSKVIHKFQFAFHLILKGIWNPELEEEEEREEE